MFFLVLAKDQDIIQVNRNKGQMFKERIHDGLESRGLVREIKANDEMF